MSTNKHLGSDKSLSDQDFTHEIKTRAIRRAQAKRRALLRDLDNRRDKVRKATKSKSCTLRGPITEAEMEGWS